MINGIWQVLVPETTIDVAATPEAIWAIVSDSTRTAEWLTPVRRLDGGALDAPLGAGQSFKVAVNGRVPAPSLRVQAVEARRRLRCTIGPGFAHSLGLAMRVEVRLSPTQAGTSVTVEMACNRVTGRLQKAISGIDVGAAAAASAAQLKQVAEDFAPNRGAAPP